jgi:hypothetical protein
VLHRTSQNFPERTLATTGASGVEVGRCVVLNSRVNIELYVGVVRRVTGPVCIVQFPVLCSHYKPGSLPINFCLP